MSTTAASSTTDDEEQEEEMEGVLPVSTMEANSAVGIVKHRQWVGGGTTCEHDGGK